MTRCFSNSTLLRSSTVSLADLLNAATTRYYYALLQLIMQLVGRLEENGSDPDYYQRLGEYSNGKRIRMKHGQLIDYLKRNWNKVSSNSMNVERIMRRLRDRRVDADYKRIKIAPTQIEQIKGSAHYLFDIFVQYFD